MKINKVNSNKINKRYIKEAIEFIDNGGLVILPTETVYVASVDPENQSAVNKLISYKNRPFGKPFTIAAENIYMAKQYAYINDAAKNLYKNFNKPLTIVSRGRHKVALGIESELYTIGIIIPHFSKILLEIISKRKKPITVPSANTAYQKRPYKISDILNYLSTKQKGLIDLILDAGELPHNEPSTVIDTTLDDPTVLRQGEVSLRNKNIILSRNEENTQNIGKELWQKYEKYSGLKPIIFALEGPMGAGKTQFTKGLGHAMQINEEVISPTYSLILEYKPSESSQQLTHMDAWRLRNAQEIMDLGFDTLVKNKNMTIVIEWAEKVTDIIKNYIEDAIIIWVKISYGKEVNQRIISWGIL